MRLLLTVAEVAKLLGVSQRLVYDEIARKKIHAVSIGGRRMIPRTEVERIVGSSVDWSTFA